VTLTVQKKLLAIFTMPRMIPATTFLTTCATSSSSSVAAAAARVFSVLSKRLFSDKTSITEKMPLATAMTKLIMAGEWDNKACLLLLFSPTLTLASSAR
jgi:hypothetical protein